MVSSDILTILFPVAMIVAAGTDVWRMIIPNTLILILAGAFFPLMLLCGIDLPVLLSHIACGLGALFLCITLFAAGWMGGGDAKLIAATVLWLGPGPVLWEYVVLSSLLGGVVTLAILFLRLCLRPTTGLSSLDRILDREAGVPYGIALGLAGLFVYASPNFPF